MKRFYIFLLLLFAHNIHATVTVGNFSQGITAKVFDLATGNFYIGLGRYGGANAVSVGTRPDYGAKSIFTGIATQQPINNNGIEFLTLATYTGNLKPILALVIRPENNAEPIVVNSLSTDGSTIGESGVLLDASGLANQNGATTSGIVGLAASQSYIFPAVRPCGGDFGADCNGGIASVAINQSTLGLMQVPAIPGDGGVKAKELDPTTPEIYINNSPTITPNQVDLYWDDQLQRLYIGIETTTAGLSSSGATCALGTGICPTSITGSCPAGLQYNFASQTCATCPSGGFFNAASQTCQLCPPGSQFDINTLACETVTCPYGQFYNPNPAVLDCITCPQGWTFNSTTYVCTTCPNGGIYDPSIPGCTQCPSGQVFSPALGVCVVPSIVCGTGYSFCPQTQGCVFTITCPAGSIFDPSQNCTTCITVNALSGTVSPNPVPPASFALGFNGAALNPEENHEERLFNPDPQGPSRALRAPTASGGRSVVAAQVDSTGGIIFSPIAPDSAFTSGDLNDRIVGALDIVPHTLTATKLRVMHASTGPSYLIVDGGDSVFGSTNNTIYALPLVDRGDPTDPVQGTLADVNSALVNYKFVTPAVLNSQLGSAADPAVQVGAGPLDILSSTYISDINVIQDTVYVSISHSPSFGNDGGILYSQALFDETGKIIRWTPWTKKAFPPFNTSTATLSSSVKFFSVDAVIGKLWVVDNSGINVLQNSWTNMSQDQTSLISQLNNTIVGTANAVLDLDQSTRGFLANQARYALFAGGRNVVFTLVSTSTGSSINSAQLITNNFSTPNNFLLTSLPSNSCQITTLEYSRQLTGTPSNYFFAGTRHGVYVFSDAGNGFDVSTMGALNTAPFTTGSWQLAPNIPGLVVAIKTTGNALYILVTDTMIGSTLYRVPFQTTLAAMFDPSNIFTLAQSFAGSFTNVIIFNSLQIISTTDDGSTEQIVLGTNNGLFISTKAGGVQTATSDADAQWTLEPNSSFYYNGIAKIDNASIPVASPSTVWPFYISNSNDARTFDRTVLQQLNGTQDTGPFNFVPPFFNSIETNNPVFTTIPLITYFWSDGARRIGIVANIASSCAPAQLLCLPYDTLEWDIDNPEETVLSDPFLNKVTAFYWIKQIGVTGLLMAGTNKGIVALA